MNRQEAFRRAAIAYRRVISEWTEIAGVEPAPLDGELLRPPSNPAEQAGWLEKMRSRLTEWINAARETAGARRDRLVRRIREAIKAGLDAARAAAIDMSPWVAMQKALDTEFGKNLGRSLGFGVVAAVIAAAWYFSKSMRA